MKHFSIQTRNYIYHSLIGMIIGIISTLLFSNMFVGIYTTLISTLCFELKHVIYHTYVPTKISNIFKFGWESFDITDFVWTIIGGIIGSLLIIIII